MNQLHPRRTVWYGMVTGDETVGEGSGTYRRDRLLVPEAMEVYRLAL